ncbi:hypothetical protein JCM17846_31240 [Iodidimonas nitroreducens]|uniref:PRC-barrel domain-containing protein n=1 Tax=Iodidimonas nitroreducens TaxID=1236968 RepID=A0A5A7NB15_9PROT|nr:PRC-barrel domain-containing protein [Iodidimonas nitroreducens]GAK34518.1 PRC-barrel domain protein [alpha proteobacterium Q-1]GER05442.1 hypothetical protein JCM17846_31240 [Iodidimonas nitroreducens]
MTNFKSITTLALTAAFALPATALNAYADQYTDKAGKQMEDAATTAQANIEGRDVVSTKGEAIGSVEKLVVSKDDNKLHAVVSVGGFLGVGDKDVAVPYEKLQIGAENVTIMTQEAKTDLRNMPEYDESKFSSYDKKAKKGIKAPKNEELDRKY